MATSGNLFRTPPFAATMIPGTAPYHQVMTLCLCRYFPTLCRLADTRRAGVCCSTEEVTTSTTAAPVLAPRCGEVSFSVETEDKDKVQFPGDT